MSVEFAQKWVEQAVCGLLGKDAAEQSDLARIKYLAIGESFDNDFFIEMSLQSPPRPFVNTDGGDEWAFCLRGEDIARLTEKFKDKTNIRLSMYKLGCEDKEWQRYCFSDEAKKLWEKFRESVVGERYYEEHSDFEFDIWYEGVRAELSRDPVLFTGVEVLRVKGLELPSPAVLEKFSELRAAEFVETLFLSTDGIDVLQNLEQLSCRLD